MKFLSVLFLLAVALNANAQSEKFLKAMQKNMGMMDSSFKSGDATLSLANNFERIAIAEKKEWLPYYYAAFMQVNYGFQVQDKSKVDGVADKAEMLINTADSLSPENSEISCVRSMIASCRLMVDPMNRYMKFGKISSDYISQAIKQDSTNPRPLFLRAQSLKFTPEQFGGGCKKALPVLNEAKIKFDNFHPASPIHPDWGKAINENLIAECSSTTETNK